jgi:hypothetical protein
MDGSTSAPRSFIVQTALFLVIVLAPLILHLRFPKSRLLQAVNGSGFGFLLWVFLSALISGLIVRAMFRRSKEG